MNDAVQLVLTFWNEILVDIPNSPFEFLIALAIVLIILSEILYWATGGWMKGGKKI